MAAFLQFGLALYREMSDTRHVHLSGQCQRCGHKPGRSSETLRTCHLCGGQMSRPGLHFHVKHVKRSRKVNNREERHTLSVAVKFAGAIFTRNIYRRTFVRSMRSGIQNRFAVKSVQRPTCCSTFARGNVASSKNK